MQPTAVYQSHPAEWRVAHLPCLVHGALCFHVLLHYVCLNKSLSSSDSIRVLSCRLYFTLASSHHEAVTTICHHRVCPPLQTYPLLSYDPRLDPTTAPGP